MLKVPELQLVTIIERGLKALKHDYDTNADKDKSVLSLLYKNIVYDKYNLLDQAVVLFVTNMNKTQGTSNRKISVKGYFDRNIKSTPAIHISAPSETEIMKSIGEGFGEDVVFNDDQGTHRSYRRKSHNSRHAIVFTSDNHIEVQLMYFTVKSLLHSIFDELTLDSFQNPTMTGSELRLDTSTAPQNFFARSLVIESFYENNIPSFFERETISSIMFPRSNDEQGGDIGDEDLTINIL